VRAEAGALGQEGASPAEEGQESGNASGAGGGDWVACPRRDERWPAYLNRAQGEGGLRDRDECASTWKRG
jgi:hypothetical protein